MRHSKKDEQKGRKQVNTRRGQPFFYPAGGGASPFSESTMRLQLAASSSAYQEANLHIFQLPIFQLAPIENARRARLNSGKSIG
jgi:hypothetical protein